MDLPLIAGYVNGRSAGDALVARSSKVTCIEPAIACSHRPNVLVTVFNASLNRISEVLAKRVLVFRRKTEVRGRVAGRRQPCCPVVGDEKIANANPGAKDRIERTATDIPMKIGDAPPKNVGREEDRCDVEIKFSGVRVAAAGGSLELSIFEDASIGNTAF